MVFDYNEIFSHVVNNYSIRVLVDIVNKYNLELEKLSFENDFLNGDIEEIIYMEYLEGFVQDKSKVFPLKKIFVWWNILIQILSEIKKMVDSSYLNLVKNNSRINIMRN